MFFFIKKTIKLNSQLAQYEKKTEKDHFGKKIIKKEKKKHIGKHCSNPQCFFLNDKVKFSTSSIL
jgi:hypothetical protein